MLGLLLAAALAVGEEAQAPPAAVAEPIVGSTGETVLTGKQIADMGGKPPKLLDSPEGPDVEALYRQGIQGEIHFSGYVGADGRMHDVTVLKSSRSPDLDTVARSLVEDSRFTPATDAAGEPVAVKVTYPVSLWKDTLTNPAFLKKSCGQFVVDADWFAQAFPEEKREKYRGWTLANGMLIVGSVSQKIEVSKLPDFASVYEQCKAHPERKFFSVLTRT